MTSTTSTGTLTKNIVIVGGGYGGLATFNALSAKLSCEKYSDYNIILINSRSFFIHLPGTLRIIVTEEEKLEKLLIVPYNHQRKGKGDIIFGTVVKILPAPSSSGGDNSSILEGGSVLLEDGQEIPYSVLVFATGNTLPPMLNYPRAREDVKRHMLEWRDRLEKAESIVLIGGGGVGIEAAGEIKGNWPNKIVTIVHGGSQLFTDFYPDRWRQDVAQRLRRCNIELVLDDRLDSVEIHDRFVHTRKRKKIPADLVIPTWGGRPNTQLLAEAFGPEALTKGGLVEVRNTLQLRDHLGVFALGNIINWREEKQAGKCRFQGPIVADNIVNLLDGREPETEYKGSLEKILLAIGRKHGAAYINVLGGIMLGDRVVTFIKWKHYPRMLENLRRHFDLGRWEGDEVPDTKRSWSRSSVVSGLALLLALSLAYKAAY